MAIEIKPGAKSFATLYQIQPKKTTTANGDRFDVALSEKLQTLDGTDEAAAATPIESSDKVVFTNVIQEMRRRIDTSSEQTVDFEKIARIRKAIEEGTYVIDANRIAEKMLQYAF